MRPRRLIGIVGTATDIGKTWASAELARSLRSSGHAVVARKPAQSFDPDDAGPTDAAALAHATGENPDDICPPERSYTLPMAPPMAAAALGLEPVGMADLLAAVRWPEGADFGLLETVGGVCSPVALDGHSADLVRLADVDEVVLVADAGLGTIDAVRTATPALYRAPIVFLNRFDQMSDLHRRNLVWLRDVDGVTAETTVAGLAGRLAEAVRR